MSVTYNCRLCGRVESSQYAVSLHNGRNGATVTFDICVVCIDKTRIFLQSLSSPGAGPGQREKDAAFLKSMGIIGKKP